MMLAFDDQLVDGYETPETGANGVKDRIVENGFSDGVRRVRLFESAMPAASTRRVGFVMSCSQGAWFSGVMVMLSNFAQWTRLVAQGME